MNRSIDGFVELADYAVLSDGRTSALLALDGQIDWWALPAMDDLPLCGALLDPAHGGHVFVRPENYVAVERRYVPSTNVLETTFVTGAGTVVVTSALNTGASGRLPWTELVFSAAALGRPIRMIWEFRPGNHLGVSIPRVAMVEGVPIVNVGDHNIALIVATSGSFEVLADRVRGELHGGRTPELAHCLHRHQGGTRRCARARGRRSPVGEHQRGVAPVEQPRQ